MPRDPHNPIPTPPLPEYFDYPSAATEAAITDSQLLALTRLFEADYPHDLMLRELHILRACNAIAAGRATIESILSAPSSDRASAA